MQTFAKGVLGSRFEEARRNASERRNSTSNTAQISISRAAKGCIFLVDEGLQQLTLVSHRGHAEVVAACRHLPFGTGLCGRAAQYGELVFADRIDGRHEIETAAVRDHGHYCVPIKEKDQLYGVLNLTLEAGYRRDLADEQLLECYANVLAMIIQRRRAEDALRTDRERLRLATCSAASTRGPSS